LERLTPHAVKLQIPDGHEDQFKGIVDLLTMDYYTFEGDKGEKIIKGEIPAHLADEAKRERAITIEKIVEQDDQAMSEYLDGKRKYHWSV